MALGQGRLKLTLWLSKGWASAGLTDTQNLQLGSVSGLLVHVLWSGGE